MSSIPIIYLVVAFPVVMMLLLKPEWAFYAFMVGLPLDTVISGDIFSLPKILGFLALASFLLSIIIRRKNVKFDAAFWVMMMYLAWCTLSYFWSINPSASLARIFSIIQFAILYILIINLVATEAVLSRAMLALGIGAAVLAGTGVVQLRQVAVLNQTALSLDRLAGAADNANWYFVVAICMIPALYWLMANYRNWLIKLFAFLIAGALFVTALYTQSRGGLISLGIFFLAYLVLTDKKASAVLILSLVGLMGFLIMPSTVYARFLTIGSDPFDRLTVLWPAAWLAFTRNMWIGSGIGTSSFVMYRYLAGYRYAAEALSPHNSFLAIGIDTGLVGIALYLSFALIPIIKLLIAFVKGKMRWHKGKMERFGILLLCALLAYITSWFKGGGMEYQKMLWVLVGLESAVLNIIANKEAGESNYGDKIQSDTIKR